MSRLEKLGKKLMMIREHGASEESCERKALPNYAKMTFLFL